MKQSTFLSLWIILLFISAFLPEPAKATDEKQRHLEETLNENEEEQPEKKNLQPLRLTHNYDEILNSERITVKYKQKLKKVIYLIELYFSHLIKVASEKNNNMFTKLDKHQSDCLFIQNIPETDKTEGVPNSDLHIYYTLLPMKDHLMTIAASVICSYSEQYQRPNFGSIAINFHAINLSRHLSFSKAISVFIHEVIHILGFTKSAMSKWRDSNNRIYNYEILKRIILRESVTTLLMTPNVVETAKKYYNCPLLEGMQLENSISGGRDEHWEASILIEEILQPKEYYSMKLSVFTIALLRDTGFWDEVNENMATPIFWGKNKGCEFYFKTCQQEEKQIEFFDNYEIGCDFFSISKGKLVRSALTDSCYSIQPKEFGNCSDGKNNNNNPLLNTNQFEHFSNESRCFVSQIYKTTNEENQLSESKKKINDVCYKSQCSEENTQIIITIDVNGEDIILVCQIENEGDYILAPNDLGKILCPDSYERFCSIQICKNMCSSKGICIRGICHCIKDRMGEDCSIERSDSVLVDDKLTIICPYSFYLNPDRSCRRTCPLSYYQHLGICEPCDQSCSACDGPSNKNCKSCQFLTYLIQKQCMRICPIGFYGNDKTNKCEECKKGCLICQGLYNCSECKAGFDLINNLCAQSRCAILSESNEVVEYQYCKRCTDVVSECLECADNFYLDKINRKCHMSGHLCPRGTYGDSSKKECVNCSPGCTLCHDDRICLECSSVFGYRLTEQKVCTQCDYPCLTCFNIIFARDMCILCDPPLFYHKTSCVEVCPVGYQPNETNTECILLN